MWRLDCARALYVVDSIEYLLEMECILAHKILSTQCDTIQPTHKSDCFLLFLLNFAAETVNFIMDTTRTDHSDSIDSILYGPMANEFKMWFRNIIRNIDIRIQYSQATQPRSTLSLTLPTAYWQTNTVDHYRSSKCEYFRPKIALSHQANVYAHLRNTLMALHSHTSSSTSTSRIYTDIWWYVV